MRSAKAEREGVQGLGAGAPSSSEADPPPTQEMQQSVKQKSCERRALHKPSRSDSGKMEWPSIQNASDGSRKAGISSLESTANWISNGEVIGGFCCCFCRVRDPCLSTD